MNMIAETKKPLSWTEKNQNLLDACLNLDDDMTHEVLYALRQQIQDTEKPLEELFAYLMGTFLPIAFTYQAHLAEKGAPGSEDIEARAKAKKRFEQEKLTLQKSSSVSTRKNENALTFDQGAFISRAGQSEVRMTFSVKRSHILYPSCRSTSPWEK